MAETANESPRGANVMDALLGSFLPQLDQVVARIEELKCDQTQTLSALQRENRALVDTAELQFITETMARVPIYQKRTTDVCREMVLLHERIVRVKQRALRLAEKAQEDMTRNSEKERMLAAQPSASLRSMMEQEDAQRDASRTPPPAATVTPPAEAKAP